MRWEGLDAPQVCVAFDDFGRLGQVGAGQIGVVCSDTETWILQPVGLPSCCCEQLPGEELRGASGRKHFGFALGLGNAKFFPAELCCTLHEMSSVLLLLRCTSDFLLEEQVRNYTGHFFKGCVERGL